jgi:hypothetical protein
MHTPNKPLHTLHRLNLSILVVASLKVYAHYVGKVKESQALLYRQHLFITI